MPNHVISRLRCLALLIGLSGSVAVSIAQQQLPPQPAPRLLVVTPAGGQAGTTVEVEVVGQDLADAETLLLGIPNARVEKLDSPPLVGTPQKGGKAKMSVTADSGVRFRITLPADAPLGTHDLRVLTKSGVTNPRAFVIGDRPQRVEREPNNDVAEAQEISLNSVVFGTIATPTDVDYFRFQAKKNERLLVSVLSSSIDSRLLADVQVFALDGRLIGSNRNYQRNEALADLTIPEDGSYLIRLAQFTYTAGSNEYFYRLQLGTFPWIDAVVPGIVPAGRQSQVTVYGRNLPGGSPSDVVIDGRPLEKLETVVTAPAMTDRLDFAGIVPPGVSGSDGFTFRLRSPHGVSNPYLLGFAAAPIILDNGANETPETAQAVTFPCDISGAIEKRRDRDYFRISARKGDIMQFDLQSERLGAACDLYFTLTDPATGKQLGEYDENPLTLSPSQWYTRTEDPAPLRFEAPADGEYLVMVTSREAFVLADIRNRYRLRITQPQPDFRLIVMTSGMPTLPEGCTLNAGGAQVLSVYAWRHDGFTAPIALSVEGLPNGVTAQAQTIPAQATRGTIILSAAPQTGPALANATITGTAVINGKKVVRTARPASPTWGFSPQQNQQTIPLIARLDREFPVAVRGTAAFRVTLDKTRVLAEPNEQVEVQLRIERTGADPKAPVTIHGSNMPTNVGLVGAQGNTNPLLTVPEGKDEIPLKLDVRANAVPGEYPLTFLVRLGLSIPDPKDAKKQIKAGFQQPTPMVTLVVLPKQAATLKVIPAEVRAKVGETVRLKVEADRAATFTGPIRLTLLLPEGVKGLEATPTVLPTDATEATMELRILSTAQGLTANKLVIRGEAELEGGRKTTQEARFALRVDK